MFLFLFFMKGGGGGGTTTVTTNVPPPSPEETEQIRLNNMLTNAQIDLSYREVDGKLVLLDDLQQLRDFDIANALADQENIELGRAALTKFLKGDVSITDEQKQVIEDSVTDIFETPALAQLERFAEERIQQFKELAATSGRGALDPTFAKDLTKEVGRLGADISIQAGAEKARQAFSLGTSQPLEASKISQTLGAFRQQLEAQRQVNLQNLQNRIFQQTESLADKRFAQASTTRTTSGGGSGGGGLLGGAGSFLSGVGTLYSSGIFCYIAEALYGVMAIETFLARQFMSEHQDNFLVRLYGKYGKQIAPYVKQYSIVKYGFKILFDRIVAYQASKTKQVLIGVKNATRT